MTVRTGTVRADGSSTLVPGNVYDMASSPAGELSPELEAKFAELSKSLEASSKQTEARFRIEVFFYGGPRKTVDVKGVVAVWTNGGYLNGGGDASVYLCPQPTNDHPCMAPIDMQFVTSRPSDKPGVMEQAVLCTQCRRLSRTDDLIGQMVYNTSTQHWAHILSQFFYLLSCSADLSISSSARACIGPPSSSSTSTAAARPTPGSRAKGSAWCIRSRISSRIQPVEPSSSGGFAHFWKRSHVPYHSRCSQRQDQRASSQARDLCALGRAGQHQLHAVRRRCA